uniref:Wax synthase domain-containing protein n=1 Tax=Emiliania huxleyi TaxID=2903 RepID=A0A7S3RRV0_EMIHU
MPSLLLPDAQPILTALAILALTTACRFGFAVVTRLLGTSKRLLWPAAGAMASLPFVLREPLLAWWGGTYADAQLGSFLAATAFAWCFFRAIERSVGTTPVGAAASLAEWIFYMSADVDPRYRDGRPLRPPPGKLQSQLAKLCATYAATAAFVSAIEPFGFRPTAAVCEACGVSGPLAAALVRVGDNLSGAAFRSSAASAPLLLASQLGALAEPSRNLLSAGTVLIYLFLSLLLTLGSILVLAQGHDPIDGFDNPVFKSCSPREFWGRRWNLQVNAMLKRSCYKPLAGAGLAAPLATLATFGASAGFHEYQFALSMPGYRPARYPYRCHYCCYWYSHHHC